MKSAPDDWKNPVANVAAQLVLIRQASSGTDRIALPLSLSLSLALSLSLTTGSASSPVAAITAATNAIAPASTNRCSGVSHAEVPSDTSAPIGYPLIVK